MVINGWSRASPFMSEPRSRSPCSLTLPASSLCPLCCLPAPSPLAAVSHLSHASASSTAKLIWLRSSEIPARDGDGSQFDFCCWADRETKWRGVMGEGAHKRCGRRANVESEGMEKDSRRKRRSCERWGESRTAVVERNRSTNKNSFANCTGGGG